METILRALKPSEHNLLCGHGFYHIEMVMDRVEAISASFKEEMKNTQAKLRPGRILQPNGKLRPLCAWGLCRKTEELGQKRFQKCGKCKKVNYCCRDHQLVRPQCGRYHFILAEILSFSE